MTANKQVTPPGEGHENRWTSTQAEKELREHFAAWIAETPADGKAAVAPKGWFAKQYSAPKAKAKKG